MSARPARSNEHGPERSRPARRGSAVVAVGLLLLGTWSAAGAVAQALDKAATAGMATAPPAPVAMPPETKPLSAAEAPRYMRQLARQLRAAIAGTPMELSKAPGEVLKLRIPAAYLFDLDAAPLRAEGPVRLDPLVAVLEKSDRTELVVVGHTDTLGTREFNAAWSLRRATAVADYLQAQGLVAPRVTMRGAGELELREKQEDTPAARERNRRIEIEVRPSRPSRRAAS